MDPEVRALLYKSVGLTMAIKDFRDFETMAMTMAMARLVKSELMMAKEKW